MLLFLNFVPLIVSLIDFRNLEYIFLSNLKLVPWYKFNLVVLALMTFVLWFTTAFPFYIHLFITIPYILCLFIYMCIYIWDKWNCTHIHICVNKHGTNGMRVHIYTHSCLCFYFAIHFLESSGSLISQHPNHISYWYYINFLIVINILHLF